MAGGERVPQPILTTGSTGWEPLAQQAFGLLCSPMTPSEARPGLPLTLHKPGRPAHAAR